MELEREDNRRRYRIRHVLGEGGFGKVYRAQMFGSEGFTRDVALKLLRAQDHPGFDDALRRLRDEARILGLIHHPAVVGVHGLVRLEPGWAVVLEFVEGVDGEALAERGSVPLRVVLELIGEVASALRVAWEQPVGEPARPLHVVHRDIKPANIRITPEGRVKVLDFGAARAEFNARETKTARLLVGSLRYMAPERLQAIEGPAGDIWSLGVVMAEIFLGGYLFQAPPGVQEHRELMEGLSQRMQASLDTHLPVLVPALEAEVTRLLLEMLSYDPNGRPSASEVERRCRELAAEVGGPSIRDWAPVVVPPMVVQQEQGFTQDEWSHTLLLEGETRENTESITVTRMNPPPPPAQPQRWWVCLGGIGGAWLVNQWGWTQGGVITTPVPPTTPPTVPPTVTPVSPTVPPDPAKQVSEKPVENPLSPDTQAVATPGEKPEKPPEKKGTKEGGKESGKEPKEEKATGSLQVSVSGDATRVVLQRAGSRVAPSKVKTPGTYEILADFGSGLQPAGSVTVRAGQITQIRCSSAWGECK